MSEYLRTAFRHILPPPVADLGEQVGKLRISRDVFAGRVALLQERGLVINTVDSNPSCDVMMDWLTTNFVQDLKVEVTHLQVLEKFVFLVVLEKIEDRKKILKETLMYMHGKMILAFPWDPSFDVNTMRTTMVLVWVDLLTLNPVFDGSERGLLGQVGEVIYCASKNACSKIFESVGRGQGGPH